MTQEEKDLLFKDICARLPYNVICQFKTSTPLTMYANTYDDVLSRDNMYRFYEDGSLVRPYLRPMSSMTKEEIEIYRSYCDFDDGDYTGNPMWFDTIESFDYLYSRHFDFRNLIPRGLALEAPEGMY